MEDLGTDHSQELNDSDLLASDRPSLTKQPSIYETKAETQAAEGGESTGQSMFSLLKKGGQNQSMLSKLKN